MGNDYKADCREVVDRMVQGEVGEARPLVEVYLAEGGYLEREGKTKKQSDGDEEEQEEEVSVH